MAGKMANPVDLYIKWFDDVSIKDVDMVGGKNASLGEMTSQLSKYEIPIPPGFCTTSKAYWDHIKGSGLNFTIKSELKLLKEDSKKLYDVGRTIRRAISAAPLPPDLETSICDYYQLLCERCGVENLAVAVRSSATAEDLPEASFAGVSILKLLRYTANVVVEFCSLCLSLVISISNKRHI